MLTDITLTGGIFYIIDDRDCKNTVKLTAILLEPDSFLNKFSSDCNKISAKAKSLQLKHRGTYCTINYVF